MNIRNHYLEGAPVDATTLRRKPLRSRRIEEIFAGVKRRVEE